MALVQQYLAAEPKMTTNDDGAPLAGGDSEFNKLPAESETQRASHIPSAFTAGQPAACAATRAWMPAGPGGESEAMKRGTLAV